MPWRSSIGWGQLRSAQVGKSLGKSSAFDDRLNVARMSRCLQGCPPPPRMPCGEPNSWSCVTNAGEAFSDLEPAGAWLEVRRRTAPATRRQSRLDLRESLGCVVLRPGDGVIAPVAAPRAQPEAGVRVLPDRTPCHVRRVRTEEASEMSRPTLSCSP